MLKILHVIGSVDPKTGGPIEGIVRQSEEMDGNVLREVVSLDPPSSSYLSNVAIKVYPMGLQWTLLEKRIFPWAHYRWTPRLVNWIVKNAPSYDAIIVNGLWNYSGRATQIAFKRKPFNYYVYTHGMLDPWFRNRYPLKNIIKWFSWYWCEKALLKNARAVLFTTKEEMELARQQSWKCDDYVGRVVNYGTARPPAFSTVMKKEFEKKLPGLRRDYLLFLSRINEKKGCDILLAAFFNIAQMYPALDLVIAGPDQDGLQNKLAKKAIHQGLGDRIHWPGMLIGDEKWGALYGAVAFVLPSHSENFGIVVVESLACGCPVITTNKVNIWEEIDGNGAIITDDKLPSFTRGLARFLDLPRPLQKEMGVLGRLTFDKKFHVSIAVQELTEMISRDLSSVPKPTLRRNGK